MEIQSVKIISIGWLVNGVFHVPDVEGNTDRQAVLDWIADGNAPDPADPPPVPTLDEKLRSTDHLMARAAEGLITVLIAKGTIAMADLPQGMQDDLAARQAVKGG